IWRVNPVPRWDSSSHENTSPAPAGSRLVSGSTVPMMIVLTAAVDWARDGEYARSKVQAMARLTRRAAMPDTRYNLPQENLPLKRSLLLLIAIFLVVIITLLTSYTL